MAEDEKKTIFFHHVLINTLTYLRCGYLIQNRLQRFWKYKLYIIPHTPCISPLYCSPETLTNYMGHTGLASFLKKLYLYI